MNKKQYTYTFFWMDKDRELNVIKAKVEVKATLTIQQVYDNAENVFFEASKKEGYSQQQIDEADYMLAVQEGWCGE